MSAPVDVLAVMERGRDELKIRGQAYLNENSAISIVREMIEANRKIVAEWDYMAKHGHCRPGILGVGQTFDCWAVDICQAALARVGGAA